MNAQQLTLFKRPEPTPDVDTLHSDICSVRAAIEYADRPLISSEIKQITGLSKDRVYHALVALHKAEEIGWMSRATDRGAGRATQSLEPLSENDSEVARPTDLEGSPTVKIKAFKKSGSELFYNYICWGKEKNQRAYLGGGNIDTHLARTYEAIAEEAIIEGRFDECKCRADYYRVIGELKSEVGF